MVPGPIAAVVVALFAAVDGGTAGDATDGPADGDRDAGVVGGRGADANAAADVAPPVPTVRLTGLVLQKGSRRPLGGAIVTVDGTPAGETDAEGRFDVGVMAGSHTLQVQSSGHDPVDRRVEVVAGVQRQAEPFRLAPRQTGERYETTVRTGRPEIAKVDLAGDEARAVAGTSGDPLRVIGSLPGVSQIVWPAAIYVVRGANPGNTGFYLDGLRVPALFHIALGPSVVHPYLVSGVDFYPGSSPANYGGFVSGIMAARTSPPPTDRAHLSADVTFYDAGGIATAPFNDRRGTVAVAARYSYTGALFSLLDAQNTLRYGDYQVRVDHPVAGGQGTLFGFGSLDQIGWTAARPEYASLQFHRLDARWRRALAGGRLLAGTTLGADWSRSTLFDRPIRVRALSVAPRVGYERTFGPADLHVGGDAIAQDFDAGVPDFGRRPSDLGRARRALTAGGFATLSLRLGTRLTFAPGIRTDVFFEQGVRRVGVQPRVDVLLQASDRLWLRASGGRFAQMPSLPVSVAGFEAFGLADLGLQTSLGGSLGMEVRLPRAFTIGLTGYGQRLRLTDVRDLDLTMIDPGGAAFLVSRRGYAYGAELLVRRANEGRLFGWLAYTLSWSLREDDGGVLGRSDWDQRHILNLVGGYRFDRGWSAGARFHYNTGRNAPVIGSGGELYQQLPAFYQLDLRVERRFVFDKFLLSLYGDFANVTLTREVVQVVYEYDPVTDTRAAKRQDFYLILPTVGVHAEF